LLFLKVPVVAVGLPAVDPEPIEIDEVADTVVFFNVAILIPHYNYAGSAGSAKTCILIIATTTPTTGICTAISRLLNTYSRSASIKSLSATWAMLIVAWPSWTTVIK
jgi:hypothetical protein